MRNSRKFRFAIVAAIVIVLVVGGANVIFSKDQPTFAAWHAKIVKACTKLTDQNNAAYVKIIPTDRAPTLSDFMAFEKYFEPDFVAFETYLKSIDRPGEQQSKITEFVSAVEGLRKNIQRSATNLAAAQAEIAADFRTAASMRYGIAASALSLEKCV